MRDIVRDRVKPTKIKKNHIKVERRAKKSGFTLIEVLVVIGIIAILATVVLVAVNPSRQFKLARDTERTSHVNTILNAIGQNITEHKGIFTCENNPKTLPNSPTVIKSSDENHSGAGDIAPHSEEDLEISLENKSKENVSIDFNNRAVGKVKLLVENKSAENLNINLNNAAKQSMSVEILEKSVGSVDIKAS
jgi:prepilin-type N-terminal cleavage/methylation domain-containing protein